MAWISSVRGKGYIYKSCSMVMKIRFHEYRSRGLNPMGSEVQSVCS